MNPITISKLTARRFVLGRQGLWPGRRWKGKKGTAAAWMHTNLWPSFAATAMLGITTFIHLGKFHLTSPLFITRFVTWVWIAVYVVTLPVFLAIWIAQARRAEASLRTQPLAVWIRVGFALQALFTLPVGVLLFVVPTGLMPSWPWALTPLTARAVDTWLTAYGLACAAIFRENDLGATTGTTASLLAFCLLQFMALARYVSLVEWAKPTAWGYSGFLLVGVIVNVAAL